MSQQTILKNIYNFVDILQAACCNKVAEWDLESLDNAFKWAKYCKQIYIQSKGKSYQEELNQRITEIGQLPWSIGDKHINLCALEHAESNLRQALLQNPHLSSTAYEHLLDTYGDVQDAPEQLLQDLNHLKTYKQCSDVSSQYLEMLQGDEVVNACQIHAAAELLLQHAHLLTSQKLSRKQKSEELLAHKLEKVAKQEKGLELICTTCVIPCCGKEIAQEFMVAWILKEPQCRHVFDLHEEILAKVCLTNFKFYQSYMKHLVDSTKMVQTEIDDRGTVLYRFYGSYSYSSLQQRLTALVKCKEPVSTATLKAVESLTLNDTIGMWKNLLCSLKVSLKKKQNLTGIG